MRMVPARGVQTERQAGSGAQAQAQSRHPNPCGEPIQEQNPNTEYSDDDGEDDDEGIPNTTLPKHTIDPNIKSLDYRRNRIQNLDGDRFIQLGQFKRRKVGSVTDYKGIHPSLTPASSTFTTQPAPMTASRDGSRNSTPDDAVPEGLLTKINATLRKEHEGYQQPTVQPPHQSNGHISPPDEDDAQAESEHEHMDVQEPQDPHATDVSTHNETPIAPVSDPEEGYLEDGGPENNNDTQNNTLESRDQVDIWAIPSSPMKQPPPRKPDSAGLPRALAHGERRIEIHIPQRRLDTNNPALSSHDQTAEHPALVPQSDHTTSPVSTGSSAEIDLESEMLGYSSKEDSPKFVYHMLSDDENSSDIDLSARESFEQDVTNFRTQHPSGYQSGEESFYGPSEDDDIAIHIYPSSLRKVLLLMGDSAWTGLRGGWHQRPLNTDAAETGSIQTLLHLLAKFERLVKAAPKAPQFVEQNVFLIDHSDVLSYYFSKIKLIVHHIREILEKKGSSKSGASNSNRDRDKIPEELASFAIPMLTYILASIWSLGGDDWYQTAFTLSTMELLRRTLGWIGLLYRPLLRRMTQQSLDVSEDSFDHQGKRELIIREKRGELDERLKDLRQAVNNGLDELEEEERRREREYQDRQQKLKRQEKIKARQKLEREARRRSIEERQLRSLMSIRGIHTPLSQSSVPSSARESVAPRIPPQLPLPSRDASEWSIEEKTYLFKKIQESYPNLLDLDDVRWDLNKTLEDTEAMTEEILGLMLEAVHPDQAATDRDAHIHEIMQNYRRTWCH